MNEDLSIPEKIRAIKKDLRLAMNGVVSTLQRNQGLNYKINFGVEIPRLKGIVAKYEKDEELAISLWNDNIRECKMLAIFLLPEECYSNIIDKWVAEVPYTEIADHLAKEILCKIPDIAEVSVNWLAKEEGLHSYCGYMTLSNLFRKGMVLSKDKELLYISQAVKEIKKTNHSPIAKAAYNSLMIYSDSGEEIEERINSALEAADIITDQD